MAAEPDIHRAVLECNLAERSFTNPTVQAILAKIRERCTEEPSQPRIYVNILGHRSTRRPITPRILNNLAGLAMEYPFDPDLALKVDAARGKPLDKRLTRLGCRKYLNVYQTRSGFCDLPLPNRVARVMEMFRALQRRCNAVDKREWDDPMTGSIGEFGYTEDVESRLKDHRRHSSSNYLMNLLDALCMTHAPDYAFHQFVIYHIPAAELLELAEMYFTTVGQGYSHNGGGLSHIGAGCHVCSREKYKAADYERFLEYAHQNSSLESNIAKYNAAVDSKTREYERSIEGRKERLTKMEETIALTDKLERCLENTAEEEEAAAFLAQQGDAVRMVWERIEKDSLM